MSKIDVILMSSDVYQLFVNEMDAAFGEPDHSGWMPKYMFKGIFCQFGYFNKYPQIRFISENKIVTVQYDKKESGIFKFLDNHINAINDAFGKVSNE